MPRISETRESLSSTFGAKAVDEVVTGSWRFNAPPTARTSTGGAVVGKAVGDTNAGMWNVQHAGDYGYLFHLTTTAASTSDGAIFGIGQDYGAAKGFVLAQKSSGAMIEATAHPSSSAGTCVDLMAISKTTRPFRLIQKVGAQPMALVHDTGEGFADGVTTNASTTFTSATATFAAGDVGRAITQTTSRGEGFVIPTGTTIATYVSPTEVTLSQAATGSATGINFLIGTRAPASTQRWFECYDSTGALRIEMAPALVKFVGANIDIRVNGSNPNRVFDTPNERRHYQYNSGGSNYYASYVQASGGTLRMRMYAPAAVGSESSYTDMIAMTNGTLGFFGATPVSRPTGVAVDAAGIHAALVSLGLITA